MEADEVKTASWSAEMSTKVFFLSDLGTVISFGCVYDYVVLIDLFFFNIAVSYPCAHLAT